MLVDYLQPPTVLGVSIRLPMFHCEHKSCLSIILTILTCKYCIHSAGVDYMFLVSISYVHKLHVLYVVYTKMTYVICGYLEGCATKICESLLQVWA